MDLKGNQIKVGALLDHPPARAVFERRFGSLMHHPLLPTARNLTLSQLMGLARTYLTPAVIAETLRELEAL